MIRTISTQFLLGPVTYVLCVLVASQNAVAGFVLMIAVAAYWALLYGARPGPGHGA
ncbi:MAG: hypothetical protein ACJ789_09980 [Thermomicrobiales bacterium]